MASSSETGFRREPLDSVELAGSVEPDTADDLVELLETLPDTVYRVDADGYVRYANREARRLLGYDIDELRGMRYVELVRDDFRDHVTRFFRRQFAERRAFTYLEYPVLASDGRELWIGQTTRLLEKEGEIVGSQGVVRYIGARNRQEESRRGLALRDLETGLLNPMAFRLMVENQAARSARIRSTFTLLTFRLGPPPAAGSDADPTEALARLVRSLQDEVRASDSVCRSRSEELTLLLPDTGAAAAESMLTRIRSRLEAAAAPWTLHSRLETWDPEDPVPVDVLLARARESGEG